MDFLTPVWPAPSNVAARVTLRMLGNMAGEGRQRLQGLPAAPVWLRQVHGTSVVNADSLPASLTAPPDADAAVARSRGTVCAVMIADCMPVFMTDEEGGTVAVAHAGWRGMSAGVLESTLDEMRVAPASVIAWLGPAIGPAVYEVGAEVREAFMSRDSAAAAAFTPTRPGHWLLDLYMTARQRLERSGVKRVYGGGFCTYSDAGRFFSFRRDRAGERMAALIWLA
jgi:YfiH family protein